MRLTPMCIVMLLCACMGSPDALSWCSFDDRPAPSTSSPTPTWYADAEPIVVKKCAGCHGSGGVAPFELRTYDDVAIRASRAVRTLLQKCTECVARIDVLDAKEHLENEAEYQRAVGYESLTIRLTAL